MIHDDFDAYKNAQGFYSNAPGAHSGNDLLFSAESMRIMQVYGAWTTIDQVHLEEDIEEYAELAPGLYCRPDPFRQDQEAMDDYVGLAYISEGIAKKILAYGKEHWWYFKTSPQARWYEPIFWRWLALLAHVHWCAGRRPNLLLRAAWCISVAFSGKSGQTDPWKLTRLLISAVEGTRLSFIERWAIRNHLKRLRKNCGSLKNVYAAYFGSEHPITYWCNE